MTERVHMDRVQEIIRELEGGAEVSDTGAITDELVESECRMMTMLVRSFMDDLIQPSDIVRFGQTLGSSAEGRTHYMLDEIDWYKLRFDLLCWLKQDVQMVVDKGQHWETAERDLGMNLWVNMKFYMVLLESTGGTGISNWLDDPFTMGDWVIKQLKDWEERTGGYFQESGEGEDGAEDSLWFSTAERVLDIPSNMLPGVIRKAFALAAALLWGEG